MDEFAVSHGFYGLPCRGDCCVFCGKPIEKDEAAIWNEQVVGGEWVVTSVVCKAPECGSAFMKHVKSMKARDDMDTICTTNLIFEKHE